MYENFERARMVYSFMNDADKAKHCEKCRQCEELCPQQIPISEWMERVNEVLELGKPYNPC
jgi:uncharacterized protein